MSTTFQVDYSFFKVGVTTIYSTYLDINIDLNNVEISNLSLTEEKTYMEAKERFGSIVDYKD